MNLDLLNGKVSADAAGTYSGKGVLVGEHCEINQKARINGPAVIGPGCSIAEDAVVEQSVIWQRVRIERGARVLRSVVANDCLIGANSIVEGAVLGDNVTVPGGSRLEPGSKILPGTAIEA